MKRVKKTIDIFISHLRLLLKTSWERLDSVFISKKLLKIIYFCFFTYSYVFISASYFLFSPYPTQQIRGFRKLIKRIVECFSQLRVDKISRLYCNRTNTTNIPKKINEIRKRKIILHHPAEGTPPPRGVNFTPMIN